MLCLEQEIERVQLSPTRSPGTAGRAPVNQTPQTNNTTPGVPPPVAAPTSTKSAPVSPARGQQVDSAVTASVDVGYRDGNGQQRAGFFEGLLGCLRPVWTIIGKATTAELKQQGEILILFFCPPKLKKIKFEKRFNHRAVSFKVISFQCFSRRQVFCEKVDVNSGFSHGFSTKRLEV